MQIRARFRVALLALLLAVQIALPACASAGPGFGAGFGFTKHRLPKVSVGVTVQPVTYDTSIGNGVDATTGTANLPLRAGANRYYVNSSTGSDANTCTQAQSAATPKATLSGGVGCTTDGNGDQVLVAEGTSYSAVLPGLKNGFSATYPFVIESYDPANPTNEAKIGRATTNRPQIETTPQGQVYITCCAATPIKYAAVRGLKWNPGNVADEEITLAASNGLSNHYVLLENNVFAYSQLTLNQDLRDPARHIVVRGNSFYGEWSGTQHRQGIYSDGIASLVVEDNFFYHNGWKIGAANRDIGDASGGPTIFNHSVYMQDTVDGTIRRNTWMDASATGCSCRGYADIYGNVSIDNPIGIISGLGNNYQLIRPNGEVLFVTQNATLGDADIATSLPRGTAYSNGNGTIISRTSFNLAARTRNPSAVNVNAFNTQAGAAIPSYMDFHDNVEYSWAAAGKVGTISGVTSATQSHPTYENNAWSDPPSGSNVNIASHATPNAYTASTLYPALSLADKTAAIAAWQDHPELHQAQLIRPLLFTGYGMGTATAQDLAVSRTGFILTSAYTGTIAGVLDGSTLTALGLPACITIDGPNRTFTYDGTCSVSTGSFVVTETPLVGIAHNTTISYSIIAQPTLGTITLSTPLVSGTASSGTFSGAYGQGVGGGWLSVSGGPSGFLAGASGGDVQGFLSHAWTYDGTAFTSGTITVIETLPGATNSPHTSTISYSSTIADTGWNPADKNASVTLSGTTNVTATFANSAWNNVRGTQSHSSGKYYFEVLVGGTLSTNGIGIGLGDASASLGNFFGNGDGHSGGYYSGGFTRGSDASGPNLSTYAVGNVIGVAVDLGTHKMWFSKNGSWNGDPVAETGGYVVPSGTLFPMGSGWDSAGGTFTLRTGNASQSNTPPTGYSVWGFVPLAVRRRRKKIAANDNGNDVEVRAA